MRAAALLERVARRTSTPGPGTRTVVEMVETTARGARMVNEFDGVGVGPGFGSGVGLGDGSGVGGGSGVGVGLGVGAGLGGAGQGDDVYWPVRNG